MLRSVLGTKKAQARGKGLIKTATGILNKLEVTSHHRSSPGPYFSVMALSLVHRIIPVIW